MSDTIETTLHVYSFDVRKQEDADAYAALREKLKGYPHCMDAAGQYSGAPYAQFDGKTVHLEPEHLFDNQWNTAEGLRVFDWAQQAEWSGGGPVHPDFAPRGIKCGHYLEQTDAMRAVRRDTLKCGYCAKQEPASRGLTFCPHCIDSEYLKASELHLTRLLPVSHRGKRAPLTDAERAELEPKYTQAQIHGASERGKARIAATRARIEKTYFSAIEKAETEFKGYTWLLDHGVNTENAIYYAHTGVWCFGWRRPFSQAEYEALYAALLNDAGKGGFPFNWEAKLDDGTKR